MIPINLCNNEKCPLRGICDRAKSKKVSILQEYHNFKYSAKKGDCKNLVFA
jgi:hypothetical protein